MEVVLDPSHRIHDPRSTAGANLAEDSHPHRHCISRFREERRGSSDFLGLAPWNRCKLPILEAQPAHLEFQ